MKTIVLFLIVVAVLALSGCEASIVGNEGAMARANAQAEASRTQATIIQAEAARDVARMQTDAAMQQAQITAAITTRLIDEMAKSRSGVPAWVFAIGLIVVGGLAFGFMWMQSAQQRQTLALIADMHHSQQQTTLALLPGWNQQLLADLHRHANKQGARVVVEHGGYLVEMPTGQRVRALLSG